MREIKFRVWDTVENKMINDVQDRCGMSTDLKCCNHIVMQYTGLKDICKSDIIKGIHKITGEEIVGEVVWNEKCFGWGLRLEDWTMGFQCLVDCYVIEVIGNIHDNPELMEI